MNGPPVGVYSPKYDMILSLQPKGYVKFNAASTSPKVISNQHMIKDPSKASLHSNMELPSIANLRNIGQSENKVTEGVPEILKRHVPNVVFSKLTGRRNDLMQLN